MHYITDEEKVYIFLRKNYQVEINSLIKEEFKENTFHSEYEFGKKIKELLLDIALSENTTKQNLKEILTLAFDCFATWSLSRPFFEDYQNYTKIFEEIKKEKEV